MKVTKKREYWIQTHLGHKYWPTSPRSEDVFIGDIAKALSNLCRFTGHCNPFYSVAQHSVHVAEICEGDLGLSRAALLHDAAEAYIGDWSRPLKESMPKGLRKYLRGLDNANTLAIFERFGIGYLFPLDDEVHKADDAMLLAERRDIMRDGLRWTESLSHYSKPWGGKVIPWSPEEAEKRFLDKFTSLFDYQEEWQ